MPEAPHDSPLADQALDVAIMIHGEPNVSETACAENITPEIISHEKRNVIELISKKKRLESAITNSRIKLFDDAAVISKMEEKYNFLHQLFFICIIVTFTILGKIIIFRLFR